MACHTILLTPAESVCLADANMQAIAGMDKNCRLIKGQMFLWKDGQSWEGLWDPEGASTPP